jgi:hypothetical protein
MLQGITVAERSTEVEAQAVIDKIVRFRGDNRLTGTRTVDDHSMSGDPIYRVEADGSSLALNRAITQFTWDRAADGAK